MPKFMRKTVILAKVEVTPGTDPTPTGAANAMLVRNVNLTPLDLSYAERNIVRGFFGNFDALPTLRKVRLSFEVEAATGGALGTAPAWGPLMKGCGTTETINASTSVIYAPNSANTTSLTIYVNIDGVLHKMLYARGNCTIRFKANEIPVMAFDFIALDGGQTDTALPTPTYTAFQTPQAASFTNTLASSLHSITTLAIESAELNFGNQIEQISRIGAESIQQTDRRSTGSITFEATSIATKDWYAAIKASTDAPFSLTHGTTTGYKFKIDAPLAELTQPTFSDQQGIQMMTLPMRFLPSNSGNDEFSVTLI